MSADKGRKKKPLPNPQENFLDELHEWLRKIGELVRDKLDDLFRRRFEVLTREAFHAEVKAITAQIRGLLPVDLRLQLYS